MGGLSYPNRLHSGEHFSQSGTPRTGSMAESSRKFLVAQYRVIGPSHGGIEKGA
jgi:hypothetical protein